MLRIDALTLRVSTGEGPFGTSMQFVDGLNVFRADNTSGKSTCVQAILYALGLEGMLSASRAVPLPHAMTHLIENPENGSQVAVLDSKVLLQISNRSGEAITIQRWATHPEVASELITVWMGPALTASGDYDTRDFFVRRQGAAVREAGFHRFLEKFLGWDLPEVQRTDGSSSPLHGVDTAARRSTTGISSARPARSVFMHTENTASWETLSANIIGEHGSMTI